MTVSAAEDAEDYGIGKKELRKGREKLKKI
jgi:hypothetical protein